MPQSAKNILASIRSTPWFWIFSAVAIGLIVASLLMPPRGIIDPSVLTAVGELFAFAALGAVLHAIDRGVDAKFSQGNTSIEVNSPDNSGARR